MAKPIVLLLYRANVDQYVLSVVKQAIPLDAFEIVEWKDLNKDAKVWMENLREVIENQLCYRILILMQDANGQTNENVAFELGFTSGYQLGRSPYDLAHGIPTGKTIPIATKEALDGKIAYPADLRSIAHISYPCELDEQSTLTLQNEVTKFIALKSPELLFLLPRKIGSLRYFSDLHRDRQKQVDKAVSEFSNKFTKRQIQTDVTVVVSTMSESFQSILDELERSRQLGKGNNGLVGWSVNLFCRFLKDSAFDCPDEDSLVACAERLTRCVYNVTHCANRLADLATPVAAKSQVLVSLKHLEESIAVSVGNGETEVQASHWKEALGLCLEKTSILSEKSAVVFLGAVAKSMDFAADAEELSYGKAEELVSSVSESFFSCKVKLDDAASNDAFAGNSSVGKNLLSLLRRATANHLAEPSDPGKELRILKQSAVSVAAILGNPDYLDTVKAHQAAIFPHLRETLAKSAEDVRALEALVQQHSAMRVDKSRIPKALVKPVNKLHESVGKAIFRCDVAADSKATSLTSINGGISEIATRISEIPFSDNVQLNSWKSFLEQAAYEIRTISDRNLPVCKSHVSVRIKDAIRKASSTKWAREVDSKLGPALAFWSSCAIACLTVWLLLAFVVGRIDAKMFADDSPVWRYVFHPNVRTKWNDVVLVGVGLGIACAFSGVPRFIRFREFTTKGVKPLALFASIVAVSSIGWVPSNLGRLGEGAASAVLNVNTVRALLTFIAIVSILSLIPHATRIDRSLKSVIVWLFVKAISIFAFSVTAKIATNQTLRGVVSQWKSAGDVYTATLPVLIGALMIAMFYFIFEAFVMSYMTYRDRNFTKLKD